MKNTIDINLSNEKDQWYLSSLFSAMLRGIALSIRTLSPTDRLRRLFTKRFFLLTATHMQIKLNYTYTFQT